ncbi:testisin-like [Tenrec ecaudatus]|uniref:testisin-like n=1 Tax=Tenrec ecaudatus TaxID=94439 RepID=UPI003F59499E
MGALLLWLLLSWALGAGGGQAPGDLTTPAPSEPQGQESLFETSSDRKWTMLTRPCGLRNIHPRIVGGQDSQHGVWPWQGSLRFRRSHHCGATLLSHLWALTAAHCFRKSQEPRNWDIQFGELTSQPSLLNLRAHYNRYNVEKIVLNPHFKGYSPYDIALVKLASPVKYKKHILPVCVTNSSMEFQNRDDCWVTGWGNVHEAKVLGSPFNLQEAQLSIINSTLCNNLFYTPHFRSFIWGDMICAGSEDGSKDTCKGDSGGPLVCEEDSLWYQVGVVSWGVGCGQPNRPGVYTNVSEYFHWIQKVMSRSPPETDFLLLLLLPPTLFWAPLFLHPA